MNSVIAPWFNHRCSAPLTIACNGSTPGGVIFSSLWIALITAIGLAPSKMVVGGVMVAAAPVLSALVYRDTPESMGQHRNGVEPPATGGSGRLPPRRGPSSKSCKFETPAAVMLLGFFLPRSARWRICSHSSLWCWARV